MVQRLRIMGDSTSNHPGFPTLGTTMSWIFMNLAAYINIIQNKKPLNFQPPTPNRSHFRAMIMCAYFWRKLAHRAMSMLRFCLYLLFQARWKYEKLLRYVFGAEESKNEVNFANF